MFQRIRFLIFLLSSFSFATTTYGEGSKQLTPGSTSTILTDPGNDRSGYLAHDANLPSATGVGISSLSFLKPAGFSRNGATYSKDHRLYIRVKAGETLYYGVRRAIHDQTTANQGNLIITMRRTNAATGIDDASYSYAATLTRNTNSTRHMLLTANQSGVIDTYAEAANGPNRPALGGKAAVNNGYTPLSVTNNTGADQDYYVEFTQVGEANMADETRFSVYDLWDFTVIDATGTEKPGRMRSKLWSFSAGGASNVFSRNFNMYPLVPAPDQGSKYFVKKVELAGLAPQNFFRFVTNSFGGDASVGSTFESRRKSQNSQKDYPEFFSFVNNPDPAEWPSAAVPTFNVSISSTCNSVTGGGKSVFTLNTSDQSTLIVLLELNGTAGYQAGTADVLLEQSGPKGSRTLEWNGLNGLGQPVTKNTAITYYFRNGASPVNFPMWDAEVNNGFRVEDVRPVAGSNYNSLLFWDDTNLSSTLFPAPQAQLFGQAPLATNTNGLHSWGSASTTSAVYNAGDLKTVNTWTYGYTAEQTQTTGFSYDCNADVAVTKTVSAGPYTRNKPFAYSVTVTNNGPMPATAVKVTDLLDAARLQFVSASDAAYTPTTGVWKVGSLAVGASRSLTITAMPLVTGTITTTASQSHTEPDTEPGNNAATASIMVVPAADIEVMNTTPKTAYLNQEIIPFTLTAKNLGPDAATGVAVNFPLPAGFTLAGTAPVGYEAATGTWTIGALALNETRSITVNVRTTQTGSITAVATLASRTGYELDEVAGNNTAAHTITVSPAADLALSGSVSNATPKQNEEIRFTIVATNAGPNAATNVQVANHIPPGLSITRYESTSGTFDPVTGIWTVGTVLQTNPQTLTLVAKAAVTGSLTLTSSQSHTEPDGNSANNTAASTITVAPAADVAVTQAVSPPLAASYANGEVVTYTVTVTNNGPSTATNVVVTNLLPAGDTLGLGRITAASGTASSTGNGRLITWSVGTLASGASAALTLEATILKSAVITTTASQTHAEYDNIFGNNSASSSIVAGTGVISADINIDTRADAATYYTGEPVTFTVRATNQGPDAATNIAVASALPAGFTFSSANPKVGTYSNEVWTIPSLANGAFTDLVLVGLPVSDPVVTSDKTYTFTGARTGTFTQPDPDGADNSDATAITVQKHADVGASIVVKSNSPDGLFYHNLTEATFEITITNNGPDKVTNLRGSDTRTGTINFTAIQVPAGMTYDPATGLWTVSALDAGKSLTLVVKGIPNSTGRLNLGGYKTAADQYDSNTANDLTRGFIQVLPVADVAVTNTAPATFTNGEQTSFTVKVQNNGPDAATNLKIQDSLPAGLTFVSATTSSGSYDPASGIWTLDSDLLPGEANAQTLVLTVKPQAATTYTTTASVLTAQEYDQVAANNRQSTQIQGIAMADVTLSSTITGGPYYVGQPYTITLQASNLGPDAATGVVVTSQMPANLELLGASAPAGTSYDAATQTWTIGDLAVEELKSLELTVRPVTLGNISYTANKSFSNEVDVNGGNTISYNNSTVIKINVTDRPAAVQVVTTGKHYFFFNTGQLIAEITDPDGDIQNTRLLNGTLPAGVRLLHNGRLEVDYKYALVPGTYSLTIETTDAHGRTTQNTVNYSISGDWDNDGVADTGDIDDNNDGIITDLQDGGVNPTADEDQDGIINYLDRSFVHPVYGVFQDVNGDDINDAFDIDLDGLIRGFDIDIDGDGITNVIEANGGVVPAANIYDPLTGIIVGGVSSNGMPLAIQTSHNSGISILPNPDSDGDGRRDFEDVDTDNDGIKDLFEAQATASFVNKVLADSDRDGLNDAFDPSCGCTGNGLTIVPVNTDNRDQPDYLDLDSDNDQLADYIEAFDDNQDGQAMDDLTARAAVFESATGAGIYTPTDTDGDGLPNWMELSNDKPAYLVKGTSYYRDINQDGLVDLFDVNTAGRAATLQTSSVSQEYNFRSTTEMVTLPVVLVKFTGVYRAGTVVLTWATASETQNQYFSIERSTDSREFHEAGQVKGAGASTQLLTYSFRDAQPRPGQNYYRLKQVDLDGTFTYSAIIAVAVGDGPVKAPVRLFPNPAQRLLQVDLTALAATSCPVSIFSMDGRLIQQFVLTGGQVHPVVVENLAAGKYMLRVNHQQGEYTLSFLKN